MSLHERAMHCRLGSSRVCHLSAIWWPTPNSGISAAQSWYFASWQDRVKVAKPSVWGRHQDTSSKPSIIASISSSSSSPTALIRTPLLGAEGWHVDGAAG